LKKNVNNFFPDSSPFPSDNAFTLYIIVIGWRRFHANS